MDFDQSVSRLKPSTSVGMQHVIDLVKQNQECMGIRKSQSTKFQRWHHLPAAFLHSAGGPGEP